MNSFPIRVNEMNNLFACSEQLVKMDYFGCSSLPLFFAINNETVTRIKKGTF